jgi:hypothetical protein
LLPFDEETNMDNKVDVILTNSPIGDQSYQTISGILIMGDPTGFMYPEVFTAITGNENITLNLIHSGNITCYINVVSVYTAFLGVNFDTTLNIYYVFMSCNAGGNMQVIVQNNISSSSPSPSASSLPSDPLSAFSVFSLKF